MPSNWMCEGSETWWYGGCSACWQSRENNWWAELCTHVIWSMNPHALPTTWFSTCWQRKARSVLESTLSRFRQALASKQSEAVSKGIFAAVNESYLHQPPPLRAQQMKPLLYCTGHQRWWPHWNLLASMLDGFYRVDRPKHQECNLANQPVHSGRENWGDVRYTSSVIVLAVIVCDQEVDP